MQKKIGKNQKKHKKNTKNKHKKNTKNTKYAEKKLKCTVMCTFRNFEKDVQKCQKKRNTLRPVFLASCLGGSNKENTQF